MHRLRLFTGLSLLLASTALPASAQDPPASGRQIFTAYCVACHTIGEGVRVGPDLAGVTERRDAAWLRRVIREPDRMLTEGDPIFTDLFNAHNKVPMPNLGLTAEQVDQVLAYLESTGTTETAATEAGGSEAAAADGPFQWPLLRGPQAVVLALLAVLTVGIIVVMTAVAWTTGSPGAVDTTHAYRLRKVLFVAAVAVIGSTLLATVPASPYAAYRTVGLDVDRIIYVTGRQFLFTFSAEPITSLADATRVRPIMDLTLPAGSTVEFRVTSLDVTHGFGLYDPNRQIIAQTQAMPRYVNRLRVRLIKPGDYTVFCLEYCAAGHHHMRASLKVQ